MRLWHSKLIPLLDGRRLCDLHMSCCNLRGKGWGKPNRNINYIYDDPLGEDALAVYHHKVLYEMERRGYKFDQRWYDENYCGKNREPRSSRFAKFEEACRRNIPLAGHTLELYLNDVKALQERGLVVKLATYLNSQGDVIYEASLDNTKTHYIIRT